MVENIINLFTGIPNWQPAEFWPLVEQCPMKAEWFRLRFLTFSGGKRNNNNKLLKLQRQRIDRIEERAQPPSMHLTYPSLGPNSVLS